MENKTALHYLRVLKENSIPYQPEIRDALDQSILMMKQVIDFQNKIEKLLKKKEK